MYFTRQLINPLNLLRLRVSQRPTRNSRFRSSYLQRSITKFEMPSFETRKKVKVRSETKDNEYI